MPDPLIEHPRDAIIKVSTCAICGLDLHLFDGFMPGMKSGDIMGHEFMGEVVEVGSENSALRIGERVATPFSIVCGERDRCRRGNVSVCERSNGNKEEADKVFGHATAGLFGYTHLTGGYPGGQAEYVPMPFADKTHVKVPDGLTDEQVLFLGDIFATGWQAAVPRCGAPSVQLAPRPSSRRCRSARSHIDSARREAGRRDRSRPRTPCDGACRGCGRH